MVTGAAGLSPLGNDWASNRAALQQGRSGVVYDPAYEHIAGLTTCLTAPVRDFVLDQGLAAEGWGRVSQMALAATTQALAQSGLDPSILSSERVGLAYGSTSGSPPAMEAFSRAVFDRSLDDLSPALFTQLLTHTCLVNLARRLGVGGRLLPTSSACTSGSQAIGFAYELIQDGYQDVMLAGGAEELHVICTAVFDVMRATSTRHDDPGGGSRPFDQHRDGLVVGEGAATLVLESLAHAQRRGASILAEVVGFATRADGHHVVNPSPEEMAQVQWDALANAGLQPSDVDYVCAHATATEVGDLAEAQATASVFGPTMPISSLKGHMGHTLGACGALEAWACLLMMREGWLAPTLNLQNVDPRCAPLDFVQELRHTRIRHAMSNNFAFGGVNTSLIFKTWEEG